MQGSLIDQLSFRYAFRRYQRMILDQVASGIGDHRYHLVSPPGSGKTIVGIELARQFGFPTVVFAPTTTIQAQWREQVGMFTEDQATIREIVSLDPEELAPINVFTYQLISTAGESQEHVNEIARKRWIEELITEGHSRDLDSAQARLDLLEKNNPRAFRRELAKRYRRVKREMLRSDEVDVGIFLHDNARRLIQDLLDYGVRTVILDECHHLLDYWAIVLRHLIRQIHEPRVIGLTATLPNPENEAAYENYTSLLGEVDFEVPTPAVVKEGNLAPYRDLAYFVRPSEREAAYLRDIQQAFENAIASLTESERFHAWIIRSVLERQNDEGDQIEWGDFLKDRPLFSLAGLRFMKRISYPIPSHLSVPTEADEEMGLEDWAILLEHYGLNVLKLSPDPEDHRALKRLRQILLPFGLTLTERGLRHSRSPGDLVLTFSESKDRAVAEILAAEERAMGERLRAVVVTDFERMSSGVRSLKGVLDRDAGSALRVFHYLVGDDEAGDLDPILVTGQTLMADADLGDALLDWMNSELRRQGARATCSYQSTEWPGILRIVGEGADWKSSTYVRIITDAFESGRTRCLVGTRGILGEGWDALSLNTLIDLTSVTTSISVQQLRGRAIRLDPEWPRKVAHNWDVICVAKDFKRGDPDLRRFVRRHQRYWGVVPLSRLEQVAADTFTALNDMLGPHPSAKPTTHTPISSERDPLGPEMRGQIVKGLAHVHPDMAFDLAVKGFRRISFSRVNRHMLEAVQHRDDTYDLWGIGEDYSNFSYSATRLQARDLKIRTVYTMRDTLKKMLRSFRASVLAGLSLAGWLGCRVGAESVAAGGDIASLFLLVALFLAGGAILTFALNFREAYRLGRKLLVEQPPDLILGDIGRALVVALREAGLVSRHLQPDYVRVIEQPDQSYQVLLDYASPEDAAVFIKSYRQVFDPVRRQRYLILRDEARLPELGLKLFWLSIRAFFRDRADYPPAYHPVPKVLATKKERAQAFARHWRKYVGGGRLVYIHSEEGRQILLQARAQRRPNVKGLAFEIWR